MAQSSQTHKIKKATFQAQDQDVKGEKNLLEKLHKGKTVSMLLGDACTHDVG